jgi:hypothetical protein
MLEIFDQNPQNRVFHVDSECYVVYLGSHWEDYHPFLRLGTSPDLPDTLPPIISTIVVPDVLTGNPLEEAACLTGDATKETHYVGDIDTVEVFKHFVGKEGMPVEAIEATDHEEEDGRHVLVYYYKDGNLKIKFRKNEILDLKRREKVDSHFVARAQGAKNDYGKGPFKLPGSVYQGTGFVICEGTTYLVAKGELAALSLTADHFFELSAAGIDADRVHVVHVDKPDNALVRLFKRARGRTPLRISTSHEEEVGRVVDLFRENTLPALDARVIEGSGGSFSFHSYSVTLSPGGFEARLHGLEEPLVFGSAGKKTRGAIAVDREAGTITRVGASYSTPLVEGAVYHVVRNQPSRTVVEADYLPEKNYPYRDLISEAENTLLSQLQYYFNEVLAGRDPGKVLRTIKGLDPVRAIGKGDRLHPIVQVLVHNYLEYARLIRQTEPPAAKGAEQLINALDKARIDPKSIPAWLPLSGTIVVTDDTTYVFYALLARVTSDRYAHAPAVAERIKAEPVFDFKGERSRLADLIAGLATPEQMDEARMRRIAESGKKPTRKKPPQETVEAEKTGDGEPEAIGSGGRTQKRGRTGGGWIVPATIAALALLALFLLLFLDVIPSPWFGQDDAAIADSRSTDGADSADGTGTADGSAGDNQATDADDGSSDGNTAETDSDGTRAGSDGATGDSNADGTADGDPTLPEGWPEESLPALRALDEMPDVVISDDGVTGPGGIEITIMDIIRLVNEIATGNGFDPMGEAEVRERDPDWIYPGSVFELPNETRYTVTRGDTLWDITVRYMVARLRQDYAAYVRLTDEYADDETNETRRTQIVDELERIAAASHTENFAALVNETINEWNS